jgi:hypothetical protein
MKLLAFLVLLAACPHADAEPRNMSQHPRVGLLAEIVFTDGSSRLPDAAGSQLGQIAAWANDNFDGLVVIDGHADAKGPAAHSIRLSLRRARLVRDQLSAIGMDPSQIIISAFGPEERRFARVTVWGTRSSLESVIASRRDAKQLVVPAGAETITPQKRQARPAPARRRR